MKVTERTRDGLRAARKTRELIAAGYEQVGENGGRLWQLYRGSRRDCVIVDAKVAPDGKSVWVKIEKRPTTSQQDSTDET